MKILKLLIFSVLCVQLSYQQLLNRQQQQATHLLSYSEGEIHTQPPTSTTIAPDTTTKKKGGFFSSITGFFKGKDESTTTTTQRSTTTTTTTPKSTTTTTQKTSTSAWPALPPAKDDFPPLPNLGQPTPPPQNQPHQNAPNAWNVRPNIPTERTTSSTPPNAWNIRPNIPTERPGQPTSTTTTTQKSATPKTSSSSIVTDAELLTLSESLFSKDINNPFRYVTINYQGRTQGSATNDAASQPFLNIDEKLFAVNTVAKMKAMYDNYEQDTSINEYVLPIERKEENDFIDAVLSTPVMRHAMNFLQQKGVVTADPATHKELLKTLWFGMYSRGGGKISSSGFEHVFMSEIKNGSVIGLHNWIYFSEEEKDNDLNYKGWLKKIDLGNKGQIAKVRFSLNNIEKPVNSLFIGTSPELELALYTVCFELRADQSCRMAYGGKDFNIVTHSYRYRGKNLIGSAYPEI